jgi:putative aldouronate transport system substrate-binding protein
MSRAEKTFLIVIALLVVGVMLVIPTVPRGHVEVAKAVDWAHVHDDPQQKLTLSWMGSPGMPTAQKGTWIEQFIEQKFNIELNPTFLDWDAYSNRRPLVMASGEIPDVNWDGDPKALRRNIQQGFVMELPIEVIRKYAPVYVQHLNATGNGKCGWLYADYQGKNYGIPTCAASDVYTQIGAWRMDWLRKVGINKVPETLDEMHEAFKRFRNDDPDGNGIKDTYGFYPLMNRNDMGTNEIFAAYHTLPENFILRDGNVVWGGVTPEAKRALALLHQWYQEDLIDPDFATANVNTSGSDPFTKFLNGKVGYMINLGWWGDMDLAIPTSNYAKMKAINPAVVLAPAKPLIGLDGQRRQRVWGGAGHIIWFGKQVAEHPEKVIRVLKMFEAFATDRDLYITSRIGKRGLQWSYSPQRGDYPLPPYDAPGADQRNLLDFGTLDDAYGYYSPCGDPTAFEQDLQPRGEAAYNMTYSNPAWGFPDLLGKPDVCPSAGQYIDDLIQFQTIAYIQIIRGDKPIDYFDTFVKEWNRRGGAVLVKEANEVYTKEMPVIFHQAGVNSPARKRTILQ